MRPESLVEIQNQILGVAVDIVGTPFSLHYRSDRVPGRAGPYKLTIPVSGTNIPAGLKGIVLEIHVAGRCFTERFPPAPNQRYAFTWDGRHADGHAVQAKQLATIRVGHVYRGLYPRPEYTHWQESTAPLGTWDARSLGLGGWDLNVHHTYDHVGRVLYFGNGQRRKLVANQAIANEVGSKGQMGEAQGDKYNEELAREIAIPAEDASELYIFDTTGQHLRTLDALTSALLWRFMYDDARHLAAIEDNHSNITRIERMASAAPSAIVAPYGQRTTLSINTDGFLATISNPAGETAQFSYANSGLLISLTNPLGNISHYIYDEDGRLVKEEKPGDGFAALARTRIDYGSKVVRLTAMGRESSYTVERLPAGEERRVNRCCGSGQIVAVTSSDGRAVTYPDGIVVTWEKQSDPRFGPQASLLKKAVVKTPGGLVATTTSARSTLLQDPDNPLSLTVQTDMVSVNDRVYTRVYTAASRTLTSTTPAGRQVTVVLDAWGQIKQTQIGNLLPIKYCYDMHGRLTAATAGAGSVARTTRFSYNDEGYLEAMSDPLERTMRFVYDVTGRVVRQILPDGSEIDYTYDTNGNITALTPPSRPAHRFTYTPDDLPSAYSPPIVDDRPGQTKVTYDADHHVTSIIRPDSQVAELGYDDASRLITLTMPHGKVSYAYDATTGMLRTIIAPGENILTFDYDGAFLTTETWTGAVTGSVNCSYDNNFWITSQSVNDGSPIIYQYDADGLLIQAGDFILHRDLQTGFIVGTTLGDVTTMRSYNDFGELVSERAAYRDNVFYDVEYARDGLGRITQKIETIEGEKTCIYRYNYDPSGGLTEVYQNDAIAANYAYDRNGNRLSYIGSSETISGSYDDQDRLVQYGATTYTYTTNGELLSKSVAGQTTTYQYNVPGSLQSVTLLDKTQIEYLVDGRKRRIGKKVNGTLVQGLLYADQLNPIAELDAANNIISRFVYASRTNVPDYVIKGDTTYRIITDHLGSPRLVVDVASGAVVQKMVYDAFGNVTNDTNPSFQPFGFAGGLYDRDTKLVRFGVRDYDADTGRWMAKDPIGFEGGDANLYRYALNNPVTWFDPLGLCLILVRFAPTERVPFASHAYILTMDENGILYFRGGPTYPNAPSGPSGCNDQNSRGLWGPIRTEWGSYIPGTPDYSTMPEPFMVIHRDSGTCDFYNTGFRNILEDIENGKIPYVPWASNSNATVREVLERAGLEPKSTPSSVIASGWHTQLP
jgi:RHS repeat-associated protein